MDHDAGHKERFLYSLRRLGHMFCILGAVCPWQSGHTGLCFRYPLCHSWDSFHSNKTSLQKAIGPITSHRLRLSSSLVMGSLRKQFTRFPATRATETMVCPRTLVDVATWGDFGVERATDDPAQAHFLGSGELPQDFLGEFVIHTSNQSLPSPA